MKEGPDIKVVLIDHHAVYRISLRRLLDAQVGLSVVGEFGSEASLRAAIGSLRADVYLVCMHTPGFDPTGIIAHVSGHDPDASILVLTAIEEGRDLSLFLISGVAGILLSTKEPESLFDALRRAARGETLFTRQQMARARQWSKEVELPWLNLTDRERSVMKCLAQGLDNQQIAAAFGLSLRTVETHVAHAMEKLHVNSRLKAAVWVRDHLPEIWWRHVD